jgi:transcriptional regulator with XRE-family HTH domain
MLANAAILLSSQEDSQMTSNELKSLRNALGLTQQQMAEQIGCGYSTYARWEQRPAGEPIKMLAVYARTIDKLSRRVKP